MKLLRRFLSGLFRPTLNPNPLNQPTVQVDGDGFIPCASAQPPFDTQVLVRLHCQESPASIIALGMRTRNINPDHGQEEWRVAQLHHFQNDRPGGRITHWKPI